MKQFNSFLNSNLISSVFFFLVKLYTNVLSSIHEFNLLKFQVFKFLKNTDDATSKNGPIYRRRLSGTGLTLPVAARLRSSFILPNSLSLSIFNEDM